jgi:hypothetical protein
MTIFESAYNLITGQLRVQFKNPVYGTDCDHLVKNNGYGNPCAGYDRLAIADTGIDLNVRVHKNLRGVMGESSNPGTGILFVKIIRQVAASIQEPEI